MRLYRHRLARTARRLQHSALQNGSLGLDPRRLRSICVGRYGWGLKLRRLINFDSTQTHVTPETFPSILLALI